VISFTRAKFKWSLASAPQYAADVTSASSLNNQDASASAALKFSAEETSKSRTNDLCTGKSDIFLFLNPTITLLRTTILVTLAQEHI
jgi:hypothetical protein